MPIAKGFVVGAAALVALVALSFHVEGPGATTPPGATFPPQERPAALATARVSPEDAEQALYRIEVRARERKALTPGDVREAAAVLASTTVASSQMQATARSRDFARRMSQLTRRVAIAPRVEVLDELRKTLARETDPSTRALLVAEYRESAHELPEIERVAALASLESALAPSL